LHISDVAISILVGLANIHSTTKHRKHFTWCAYLGPQNCLMALWTGFRCGDLSY